MGFHQQQIIHIFILTYVRLQFSYKYTLPCTRLIYNIYIYIAHGSLEHIYIYTHRKHT